MGFVIKKATKTAARGRIALIGPSGSGKTWTALSVAAALGQRVCVIDTERGSASKYSDRFDFSVLELETFAPATYVEALKAVQGAGFDVIVVDSLSHAWMGKGGALEMVDAAASRSNSRNSFDAWRQITPHHNRLVDALLACSAHLVVTMRSKTEYVIEEDSRGKKVPRKIGLAPVQRDGLEYEFDVVGEMDHDHRLVVTKSRCAELADAVIERPGADLGATLRAWLSDGATPSAPVEEERDPRHEDAAQAGASPTFGDLIASIRACAAPSDVADRWVAASGDLRAWSAGEREACWAEAVQRVMHLLSASKTIATQQLKAAVEARKPKGPGPKGGAPKPAAPTSTDASGTGQDVAPSPGAQALALVPPWCSDVESMEQHVAGYTHQLAVERCARKHRSALPRAARELLALRLQRLSWDPHDREITLESARELVTRWIAAGPVERVRPAARAKIAAGTR